MTSIGFNIHESCMDSFVEVSKAIDMNAEALESSVKCLINNEIELNKKISKLSKSLRFRTFVGIIFATWAICEINKLKDQNVLLSRETKRLREEQEGEEMTDD